MLKGYTILIINPITFLVKASYLEIWYELKVFSEFSLIIIKLFKSLIILLVKSSALYFIEIALVIWCVPDKCVFIELEKPHYISNFSQSLIWQIVLVLSSFNLKNFYI